MSVKLSTCNCDSNQDSLCQECPNKINVEQLILSVCEPLIDLKSIARHALSCSKSKDIVFLSNQFCSISNALSKLIASNELLHHPIICYMTYMLRIRTYCFVENYGRIQLTVESLAQLE